MAQSASGAQAMHALAEAGVEHLFTLSGGHIFPFYEGCRDAGIRLVDFRHEQSCTFAAEAVGKLTRRPGVAAVTAGPGVTNAMSAVATARFGGSPLLLLAGRAPAATWGQGSLQEIDHVQFMVPVAKFAVTTPDPATVTPLVLEAYHTAADAHRGPAFVDIPMDVIYTEAEAGPAYPAHEDQREVVGAEGVAALLAAAERPVVVGGTDVWYEDAHEALQALAEEHRVPVILNGMGRGCLPADHELVFSRARGTAFKRADLIVVVGTPLDFRLGFGNFREAKVAHVVDHPESVAGHTELAASAHGPLRQVLSSLHDAAGGASEARKAWVEELRDAEQAKQAEDDELLTADSEQIHPARVYGALREVLARDAVVIGDGGDFVSYAGRHLRSYEPGRWLDPGPYGCLGTGMGYAAAARLVHSDAQVCLLLGDGAAGFSLMDVETLARHELPVVIVVGNNGIWALEKYPMQMLYDGWDAAADLQPGLRYDQVVEALGGAGEVVESSKDLVPALERGFEAGVPYLVNVMTDPGVAYPRSTVLA
ncbi:MAG: acetolactate synthase [Actinobacteria bacterium]|nr:acetolactate synthase [Actinomycetota bacterium]